MGNATSSPARWCDDLSDPHVGYDLNTVGNIPLEWYDEFDHARARKDELDALIAAL